jgi:hypothetical protein
LYPADVAPDTPWSSERGWDPEPAAATEPAAVATAAAATEEVAAAAAAADTAGEAASKPPLQPERVLSDHRPLIVDFSLAHCGDQTEAPKADEEAQ